MFDALYWPPDPLAEWARKHIRQDRAALAAGSPATTWRPAAAPCASSTKAASRRHEAVQPPAARGARADSGPRLANWYRVEASKYDHFQIPRRYGWRVLADAAADVPDAYVEQTGRRRARGRPRGGRVRERASTTSSSSRTSRLEEVAEPPLNDLPEPVSAPRELVEQDGELVFEDEEELEDEELADLDESEDEHEDRPSRRGRGG